MTYVTQRLAVPTLDTEAEPSATETLADALAAAYREAPTLQAQRDQLRAVDEDYAQALSELRPTGTLQVTGDYTKTVPGHASHAVWRGIADHHRQHLVGTGDGRPAADDRRARGG